MALVTPLASQKRTTGEKQWFLATETRKAARRRLDDTASVVHKLAVERDAVMNRLDRQHSASEAAHKAAKRRLLRAVAAMRSLSEVVFDVKD